jgi:uncharacterized membrane protein YgcG
MSMGAFLFAIIFTSQSVFAVTTMTPAYQNCGVAAAAVDTCLKSNSATVCSVQIRRCGEECSVPVTNLGAAGSCLQDKRAIKCLSLSIDVATSIGPDVVNQTVARCKSKCTTLEQKECTAAIATNAVSTASAIDPNADPDPEADAVTGDAAPVSPGDGTPDNTPTDTSADNTPADTTSSADDPLTTASADIPQQQAMAQGLANIPIPNINLGGGGGNLDFTTGPQAQSNWSDISSAVSGASLDTSYSPTAGFQNKRFDVAGPSVSSKPNQGGTNGQGGMGGGNFSNGGGSSGSMAANSRPMNIPKQGSRRYSSGTAPVSNMGFYAPGGKAPGGTTSAKRSTASKSKIGKTVYKPKAGGERLALSRLFGSGVGTVNEGTHSYGGGGGGALGGSCLDTVFCSMETYFQQVDRYPNSELKP